MADDLTFGVVALRTQGALGRVEREVLEATEREQQRIGSDLHDGIQGALVGIAMMLGGMKLSLNRDSSDPARLTSDLDYLINAVKDTLNQTRGLVRGLCPPELKSEGLMKALKSLAFTTTELFGVDCRFRCETHISISDEIIAMQLYRICQEAVNNAIKHSKGKCIIVALNGEADVLTLEVKDDGVGLPNDACLRGGMGLGTMDYRARMIGARLVVRRGDDGGTLVRCSIQASPEIVCSISGNPPTTL
jgi:signal transduction histidine kinase